MTTDELQEEIEQLQYANRCTFRELKQRRAELNLRMEEVRRLRALNTMCHEHILKLQQTIDALRDMYASCCKRKDKA